MYKVELNLTFLYFAILDENQHDIIASKIDNFEIEFNTEIVIDNEPLILIISEEELFYMKLKYPEFIESAKEIDNE